MSNEMIEQVAKAVFKYNNFVGTEVTNEELDKIWNCLTNNARTAYRNRAKAAIQAMREPTEEMLYAGAYDLDMTLRRQWQNMIDAALKED